MKWLIYRLHWLLGITLGVVLALMGVSGAMMSFEDEIMASLSHGVVDVAPRSAPTLTPDQLLARFHEQKPGAAPTRLTLAPQPGGSARIIYKPGEGEAPGAHGTTRLYIDPYDGRILGKETGETFFENVRLFHRYLLIPGEADGPGRHITGAAAFALIFFAASGLYLRWPRRAADWRAWLKLDLRRRGRHLYWSLHSVLGVWLLPIYLVMALTGLTWSYQWYEDAVLRLLTGEAPASAPKASGGDPSDDAPIRLDRAWATFQRLEPGGARQVIIPLPKSASEPVKFRYLYPDAPHDRAINEMMVDGQTGALLSVKRYASSSLGAQVAEGMLSVHRGSFFGPAGAIVFMLAALLMPLFAVTGWLLYLDRRRKSAQSRAAARALGSSTSSDGTVLVAHASQTGVAERLAWLSAQALIDGGRSATVRPLGELTPEDLGRAETLVVVASTFGAGEPPDTARGFARKTMRGPADLRGLRYGLLALGHSDYPDFCGFGRAVDAWLAASGAEPLFPRVEMDALDEARTLQVWRERLLLLGAGEAAGGWADAAPARPWTLRERRLLNPGSQGGEAYQVALAPPREEAIEWTAGDIAEVWPRQRGAAVRGALARLGLTGNEPIVFQEHEMSVREALARSYPPAAGFRGDVEALAAALQPLPKREYSISSLPQDGRLELLVRKTVLPDGRLGVGSGWLTTHAPLGGEIELRIRSNPGFHPPPGGGAMILIGAGTGMAGLRAHLKHREAQGWTGAWLFYGERSSATDRLHGDEVDAWLANGVLRQAAWAFSREGKRLYVQDLLRAHGECLRRALLARDTSIFVCGGVAMAEAVHAVLLQVLGQERLEQLIAERRYQRDVY
jgi:sulfite reductase (NADPH) flavoprotein alpha-component